MKKLFFILIMIAACFNYAEAQSVCCPVFKLTGGMENCSREDSGPVYPGTGIPGNTAPACSTWACKHSVQTYTVFPNEQPGYTYTWQVTGGTAASATGNPMNITWGNSDNGSIKIFISNADGSCRDTIYKVLCLKDAPVANFTVSPGTTVCSNTMVQFNNSSTGAISYFWNFGDGTYSPAENPSHQFPSPGIYDVLLTVSNDSSSGQGKSCGCSDTMLVKITVMKDPGLDIIPGCKKMLCKGDTASYCTTSGCNALTWSVTGGHIIGPANGKCVDVVWDGANAAVITLSGCPGPCGSSTSLTVPVLYPVMNINGPLIVCPSSVSSYSLPAMPGTFYGWHLTTGGTITSADSNTHIITVKWNSVPGTYTIHANFNNPNTGCKGVASIKVQLLEPFKITGNSRACENDNFSFTASGPANWQIIPFSGYTPVSFPAGATTISGSWTTAGNYTVIATPVTPTNYCSSPATKQVKVFPVPVLNNITGPVMICPGNSAVYAITSNINDGVFTWAAGGGTIASQMGSHHDSVVVNWGTTAPFTISVFQTVDDCPSLTKTLAVDSFPDPVITGKSPVCADETAVYTATGIMPPGGWQWSISGQGAIVSQSGNTVTILWNGNITPGSNDEYVILKKCSHNISLKVKIITPPSVTVTQTHPCITGATLTAGSLPCYQWYRDGMLIPGATSSVYIATIAGHYEVRCPTQCSSYGSSDVLPAFLSTLNIFTNDYTYICLNTPVNVTFTSVTTPDPGCTYQWYNNNVAIPAATGPTLVTNVIGTFYLIKTCGGCQLKSNAISLQFTPCTGTGTGSNPGNNGTYTPCYVKANFGYAVLCKTIMFTNLSLVPSNCTPSYSWTSTGGGTFSSTTAANPIYTTTAAGTYTITLTVTSCGCTDQFSATINITAPTAAFTVPASGCANEKIHVVSPPGAAHYLYVFGDGSTSTLADSYHTYTLPGTYNIQLTVSDNFGCTDQITKPITIYPAVTVSAGTDVFVCPGFTASLTATSAPSGNNYQWYQNGILIPGATSATYAGAVYGTYTVQATSPHGCTAMSDPVHVYYKSEPVAKIKSDGQNIVCMSGNTGYIQLHNIITEPGCTYSWSATGGTVSFSPNNSSSAATFASINATPPATVIIKLKVTNAAGCIKTDEYCVLLYKNPSVTINSPAGTLCEGPLYTFTATAAPVLASGNYLYQWNNGVNGNTLITGVPGFYSVTATDPHGCEGSVFANAIKPVADVSLFPVGCDTLCLTDSIHFPLPINTTTGNPSISSYTIQWYDSGTPVGTNSINLPLAAIGAGDHHFYAIVKFFGNCPVTSGTYDLFVKDCTLEPPCDNCPSILQTATFTAGAISGQVMTGTVQFSSSKPVKEVRIRIADLNYHWNDPKCINCKTKASERSCLFPVDPAQQIGNLTWDNFSAAPIPPSAAVTDCPHDLVFSSPIALPPGSYSVPVQIVLVSPASKDCQLIIDKYCMHISLKDEDCKICEKNICKQNPYTPPVTDSSKCGCSAGNNWTNLFLVPRRPGVPKPKTLIFCSSTITGYLANTAYTLSGMYNCRPGCVSIKNEVVIRNRVGDIIYTHVGPTLYEVVTFPQRDLYTVTLTAWCGDKKCECVFKIDVQPEIPVPENPKYPPTTTTTTTTTPTGTVSTSAIDKVFNEILPPDFSGAILVAQHDSILYEKYKGNKINNHSAFDLASVAKTFTAMAVLKMAEEKKLDLNDDVTKYLPSLPFSGITIKMLLSHRSGLEDYVKFLEDPSVDRNKTMNNADLLQYIRDNKEKVRIAAPGSRFDYSNTNFALLAMVIEKVSGKTYAEYLSDKFFRPLQMTDTYVFGAANAANALPSYYKNGKAYGIKYMDYIYGDKNIYTTVKDMMKWDKALRDGKIFSKETMTLAYTPGSALVPYQSNYGLGWRILQVPNGKTIVYHNGWWHGMRSMFIRLRDEDAVVIVLSNSSFSSISDSRKIADLFGKYQQAGKSIINF